MKKRIFFVLTAVILLLGAFALNAAAAEELTDVYLATTGDDANAGTADAPVLSLNKALELVANGGTVHIVDSYVAPVGFVWENHGKDVIITGGKLDLSEGYIEGTDGGSAFYYYAQGDAVTYDNLELVLKDDLYYFANGFRLQVNENVTISGKDLQIYGGGFKTAVAGTNVKLLGGSYLCDDGYASIYGGGYKANVNGDVNLYVGNINPTYTASHDGKTRLYGGGYVYSGTNQIFGDINLTIAGANVDRVCGVSHVTSAVSGDVNVRMTGGGVYSLIGGGGGTCAISGNINLTMTGGTAAQVFGANEGASYTGNVTVRLQGGTITRRFFGGCYNNFTGVFESENHVTGNVNVYIYEDMNFAWNTSESDAGFYAHSRYNPLFDDEVTNIYYISAAAQTKQEGKLGAKNSGMKWVMGSSTAVADTVSVLTKVEKWNIVLGDDIGANFYVRIPEGIADVSVLKVTVAGETKTYDISRQKPYKTGLYLIPVDVAAAQMTEPIKLQLVIDGVECEEVSYTVRQYAETILSDTTGSYAAQIQTLLKHMLDYGAAAQNYFGVNTTNQANVGYVLNYTAQYPASYPAPAVEGGISGVRFYGASLITSSHVAVRYYFTADSVEGVTFTADGKTYTAVEKNGMFYVEVPGIDPHEYCDSIALSAVKGEETMQVTYSPLTYFVRMSQKGSSTLKALVNAMYGYYEAAFAYVNQHGAIIKLPNVNGGTVAANQDVYQIGETITVTATPEAGYNLTSLTVKKDGQSIDIGEVTFAGGEYSITAEKGTYTVEATFAEKIFLESDHYDVTNQYNGTVTLLAGSKGSRKVSTYADTYRDMAVTIRDLAQDTTTYYSAELHFNFTNGNVYMIRVEKNNGKYRVQNMDPDIVSSWPTVYWLNDAQTAKLQGEGIEFRVTIHGTTAYIYLDSVCVATQDLSAGITAETTAQVDLVMYRNIETEALEIPFTLNSNPIAATVTASAENGTVKMDKEAYIAGETVTVTVTPDKLYNLTALKVMKDGEEVKSFDASLAGGSYSFATVDSGEYTVEATFTRDHLIAAPDTTYILRSATVKYTEGAAYVERGDYSFVSADAPRIDTLLVQAPGQFNKSGEEWIWIAYKIHVPADGTYTLGVTSAGAGRDQFKMPMAVNGEVHTLAFTAKTQTVTAEVSLPAGEHVVTVFWPMPANESEISTSGAWYNYPWVNIASVTVDYELTVSKPTAAEVEAEVKPNTVIAATDATTVLWSAAMGDKGNGYLEFNSRDAVKADMPYIESLYSDAFDQFNNAGEEWGWIAYKVTAPADGRYTLKLQMQGCRNAPYDMPLCVNGEVYTLSYAATGRQSASVNVSLPAGDHVVVVFMPMPKSADSSTGTDYVDYPWANPEQITVDGMLTVSLPTVEEVKNCFYTTINGGDETKILFNNFKDNGDTLGNVSAGDIRWDKPTIDMLPYGSNYLSRWPYASVKVTVEKTGTYQILVNAGVNTATKSAQLGMLVDGTAYSVPFEVASTTKMKIAVDLTAGEHVITFFLPMPKDHAAAFAGDSYYYPWMNCNSILFEHGITGISKPTVQEIQAHMLSYVLATDSSYILPSATMGSTTENNVNILNCADQSFVRADLPYIDSLITDAYGEFNKSGEEWNWFAYKVSVPEAGTYSLGVMTQNAKFANAKMPMYVNGQVYTLSFSALTQAVTAEVTLPAGEHVVVLFAPMPQNEDGMTGTPSNDYPWINYRAVIVDSALTVSLPTVTEVEGAFLPDQEISAVNTEQILHSATVNVQDTYIGRTDQATLGVDWPTIETLYTDAFGQFNKSGEEWNWFAYKVSVPYDGVYTLGVETVDAKFANYLIPLCVNGETYTLKYTAEAQEVTTRVTLSAGEHTVVMFMPMRAAKANIEGNQSNDYCWCDVGSVIVDGELTVSLPTVAEVEAVFAPQTLSAINTDYMIWSAYVKKTTSQLERDGTDGRTHMINDAVYVDNLLTVAPGEFNKSGEEWVWFAYKVNAPKAGKYILGLNVTNISNQRADGHLIPIYVNNEVYTVTCSAAGQSLTTTVTLAAGENTVVVFMPMPQNAEDAIAGETNAWKNYTWICVNNIFVDSHLTVSLPTVKEVEACFPVTAE